MHTHPLESLIDAAYERRAEISLGNIEAELLDALDDIVCELNAGTLRVAEKIDGAWVTHQWVKKAVLLYFRTHDNTVIDGGALRYFDKVPTKFAHLDEAEVHRRQDGVDEADRDGQHQDHDEVQQVRTDPGAVRSDR